MTNVIDSIMGTISKTLGQSELEADATWVLYELEDGRYRFELNGAIYIGSKEHVIAAMIDLTKQEQSIAISLLA